MSNLVVHVIPQHDHVNYYYPSSELVTTGERLIADTADMVSQLRRLVTRSVEYSRHCMVPRGGSPRQAHHIAQLTITGHGTPTSFRIGTDRVTLEMLQDPTHEVTRQLRQLRPLFTRNAVVVLRACRTGQSQPLMRALSQVLGGVRVRGSEWRQLGIIPGLIGDVVECRMDTCRPVE